MSTPEPIEADAPVLVEGESGTGKELVARLIHQNSLRRQGLFVPVDCGSIAPTIMESGLFGSLRGAFTGAERDRKGLIESAKGGTVFLDEIAEVDTGFQRKLVRFLQEIELLHSEGAEEQYFWLWYFKPCRLQMWRKAAEADGWFDGMRRQVC